MVKGKSTIVKNAFYTCLAGLLSLTSFAQNNVGIDESNPANKLSVKGNASVGSAYSTTIAPANGAIIQGNVGIGTSAPAASLDINGNIRISDGTQGLGKVLTSDGNGIATWQPVPSGVFGATGATGATGAAGPQGMPGINRSCRNKRA